MELKDSRFRIEQQNQVLESAKHDTVDAVRGEMTTTGAFVAKGIVSMFSVFPTNLTGVV